MDNKKDDNYYIEKSLESINKIKKYKNNLVSEGISYGQNQMSDGLSLQFVVLKERMSELTKDFMSKNPLIFDHYIKLTSVRNILCHNYDSIDYGFYDEIVNIDIPNLERLLVESKK